MGRPILKLPEHAAQVLLRLREMEDSRPLNSYLRALADKGWGYQSSATVLGLSRQTVHQHAKRGSLNCDLIPEAPPVPPHPRPERPEPPSLSREQIRRLRTLQNLAVKCRGHHRPGDPRRKASEELSRMINDLTKEGINYPTIGAAIGVRPMTVRARLKRHRYRRTNPSLKPYGGYRSQEATDAHAS